MFFKRLMCSHGERFPLVFFLTASFVFPMLGSCLNRFHFQVPLISSPFHLSRSSVRRLSPREAERDADRFANHQRKSRDERGINQDGNRQASGRNGENATAPGGTTSRGAI